MSTARWIILAIVAVFSVVLISIGISLVTTTSLLLATSADWGFAGVTASVIGLSVVFTLLIVVGLVGFGLKYLKKETNFALASFNIAVSVISVWYTAIIIAGAGMKTIAVYAMPLWITGTLLFVFILLFFSATDKAVDYVAKGRNKNWGKGVVIAVLLVIILNVAPAYLRSDFYNAKTGAVEVYITPSTGKIWWNKPAGVNFDVSTGERLIVATSAQIKAAKERRKLSNAFQGFASPSSSAPPRVVPAKWWAQEITLSPGQTYNIGRVKAGDQLRSYSAEGHVVLRDGRVPNKITAGIDMMTTFESFNGFKEVALKADGGSSTIRYRIINK